MDLVAWGAFVPKSGLLVAIGAYIWLDFLFFAQFNIVFAEIPCICQQSIDRSTIFW
jgi:hypothetical protein